MESITVQMEKILTEYVKEVDDAAQKAVTSVSKDAVKMLKATSPKGPNGYAKGWRVKKLGDKAVVVHNGKFPGLTHLLENGHAVRPTPKRPGKKNRVNGVPHIKPVESWANAEFEAKILQELP